MCKFTLLIKHPSTGKVIEKELDIPTKLDATERPSYIEYYPEDASKLVFHYTGSTESYKEFQNNVFKVKYGEISGRIKQIECLDESKSETDWYNLTNELEVNGTARFANNLSHGIALAKRLSQDMIAAKPL